MSTPLRYPSTAIKKKPVIKETEENTNPVCSICRSEEFYEDEQGGMICIACGTQSQDYLAEDIDDDDLAVYGGGLGNLITMRNETVKKNKNNTDTKISKLDMIPDTLEALKLYQYVLQMLFDSCLLARSIEIDGNNNIEQEENDILYRNTLKSLWMEYLHAWHENKRNSNHSLCSIGYGFTRSMKYKCQCSKHESIYPHPLLPSKPLLLGFIYLTFRIMHSNIIIADIIRWCEYSIIPYINLWEHVPFRWKEPLGELKWFFDTPSSEKHSFLSPSLILYYTSSLSYSLRSVIPDTINSSNSNSNSSSSSSSSSNIPLPALNSNLIAYKIIQQLGLPSIVWYKYIYLTQLYSQYTPIVNMSEQYYDEYIMATIIIAIRCCPDWINWTLCINTTSNTTSSMNIPIYNTTNPLQRKDLSVVLAQIRRNNILYTQFNTTKKLDYVFNSAVYTALGGDGDALHKTALDLVNNSTTPYPTLRTHSKLYHNNNHPTTIRKNNNPNRLDIPQYNSSNIYTTHMDYTIHPVAVYPESLLAEELSLSDRRCLSYMKGAEPYSNSKKIKNTNSSKSRSSSGSNQYYKSISEEMSSFIAYIRYKNDHTSMHHLSYIYLLERCAKYLYINAITLHTIIESIETKIINLVFTSHINTNNKEKTENFDTNHLNVIKINRSKQTRTIKEVAKYQKECQITLPKLKKEGIRVILSKAALYQNRYQNFNHTNNTTTTTTANNDNNNNNLKNTKKYLRNNINIKERIQFSTAADFMYIEDAYGTAVDTNNRYKKHKLITTSISNKTSKRPRRGNTTTTTDNRKNAIELSVLENLITTAEYNSESSDDTSTHTNANPFRPEEAVDGYADAAGAPSNSESDAHLPLSLDTLRRYSMSATGSTSNVPPLPSTSTNTAAPFPSIKSYTPTVIHDSDFDDSDSDSEVSTMNRISSRLTGTVRERGEMSAAGAAAIARAATAAITESRDMGNRASTAATTASIEREGILFTPPASSGSDSSSDSEDNSSSKSKAKKRLKYNNTTAATTSSIEHPAVSQKRPRVSAMSSLAAAIFKTS